MLNNEPRDAVIKNGCGVKKMEEGRDLIYTTSFSFVFSLFPSLL